MKLKVKDIQSPWITTGIEKFSKRKQRLYDKFLKTRIQKIELEYKNYKNLFEAIKKRSKKLHYSKLIVKYKENIKKTWSVIKEVLGKEKKLRAIISEKNVCGKKNEIADMKLLAENFNRYFTENGPTLAKKVDSSSANFH